MNTNRPFKGSCRKEQKKVRKNRKIGSEQSVGRMMVMEWTKFKPRHVLVEYKDMDDATFRAWFVYMGLIADMEKIPTEQQFCKHLTKKRKKFLENYFKKLGISLEFIAEKILEDVEVYKKDKERNKAKAKAYRDSRKSEIENVTETSPGTLPGTSPGTLPLRDRIDKIRLDKSIKENTPIVPKGTKGLPSVTDEEFNRFYAAYPRKAAKASALKAWRKLNGTRPSMEVLLTAIEVQRKSDGWMKDDGKYIPYPAKWLADGRWEDEVGGSVQGSLTELEKYCEDMK